MTLPKRYLLIPGFIVFLLSCEKKVTFELDQSEARLVVEATIENGTYPVVILSRSLDYFSRITPEILANSFVHNAEVYVSNNNSSFRLKEYSYLSAAGYSIFYYTVDSLNPGASFRGEVNTSYALRILTGGSEYTSTTTIPALTKQIDSIGWKPAPPPNDSNKVAVMVKVTDPPGYGDYIRYYTKRNREPLFPGLNSVFDDQIIDGTTYEVQVERGIDRNQSIPEDFVFFEKGDTVAFKLCNIDKQTYDFWRTMEYSYSGVGNPFSSPATVLGNISNGALGYFGGYAAQARTIIIPR